MFHINKNQLKPATNQHGDHNKRPSVPMPAVRPDGAQNKPAANGNGDNSSTRSYTNNFVRRASQSKANSNQNHKY